MKRKSKFPDGAFRVADKRGYRPPFRVADKAYAAASKAFFAVLEAFCPQITHDPVREYSLHAIRQLSLIVPDRAGPEGFYPCGSFYTIHRATDRQREALNALYREVEKALEAAYRSGVSHGRSLLTGLAKGEITVDQLNTDSVPSKDD